MASTGAKPTAKETPSPTTEGPPEVVQQGHCFSKKTFHKPTYCHHCTDMLWGLIGQGLICEGENSLYSNAATMMGEIRYKEALVKHKTELL